MFPTKKTFKSKNLSFDTQVRIFDLTFVALWHWLFIFLNFSAFRIKHDTSHNLDSENKQIIKRLIILSKNHNFNQKSLFLNNKQPLRSAGNKTSQSQNDIGISQWKHHRCCSVQTPIPRALPGSQWSSLSFLGCSNWQ